MFVIPGAQSGPTETRLPTTDGALMLCLHSGQLPNCCKTLPAHRLHKHWWPHGRVTLACLSMHTTHTFTPEIKTEESQLQDWPQRLKKCAKHWNQIGWKDSFLPAETFMSRQEMHSSLFPSRIEKSGVELLQLSEEVMHSGAGQDRLVRRHCLFSEPAAYHFS